MAASELFKSEFRKDRLKLLFVQSLYGAPSVGIDYVTTEKFFSDLDSHISVISRKALSGKYSFTPYRQLLVSKGAGKLPRVLSIPTVRDRLTLKALSNVLGKTFGERCKTPQPQLIVSEISGAISAKSFSAYIKLDLDNFYGSIPHAPLIKTIRTKIRKREILQLIQSAIIAPTAPLGIKANRPNEKGLPQGLSISNQLANLYASKLDTAVKCKFPKILYTRYVDDILILCSSEEVSPIKAHAESTIQKLGLSLSKDKCTDGILEADALEYLGYRFQNGIVSVRESSKRKIEKSLEKGMKTIAHSNDPSKPKKGDSPYKKLCRRITGCKVTYDGISYSRYGWLFYYSRINDVEYLGKLDSLVKKLAKRYSVTLNEDLPRFKTAYYQIRYNCRESSYFPVFDFSRPVTEIRSQLEDLVGKEIVDTCSDEDIRPLLHRVVNRIVRTLERDVGMVS